MRPRAKDILAAGPLAGLAAGLVTLVLRPRQVSDSAVALLLWVLLGLAMGCITALAWWVLRQSARAVSKGRPGRARRRLRSQLATLLLAALLVPVAWAVGGPEILPRALALAATWPAALLLTHGVRLAFRRLTGISWTGVWAGAALGVLFWLVRSDATDATVLRLTALLFVMGTALLVVLRVNHARLEPPIRRISLGLGVSALAAALVVLILGGAIVSPDARDRGPGWDEATTTFLLWALD